jgi:hypothetical protein
MWRGWLACFLRPRFLEPMRVSGARESDATDMCKSANACTRSFAAEAATLLTCPAAACASSRHCHRLPLPPLQHCVVPTPVTGQELAASLIRLYDVLLDSPEGYASDLPKVRRRFFQHLCDSLSFVLG